MSAVKRLQNSIAVCEEESDRCIPPESYYIIKFVLDARIDVDNIIRYGKEILLDKSNNIPLVFYSFGHDLYILFSSMEEDGKAHYLQGRHHDLCSKYASHATLYFQYEVIARIVELTTRTKVLAYFHTKVYENTRDAMVTLSREKLSKREASQLTLGEIKRILQERSKVIWDKISTKERFGEFYKVREVDGKKKYTVMSEMINLQETQRYSDYVFG